MTDIGGYSWVRYTTNSSSTTVNWVSWVDIDDGTGTSYSADMDGSQWRYIHTRNNIVYDDRDDLLLRGRRGHLPYTPFQQQAPRMPATQQHQEQQNPMVRARERAGALLKEELSPRQARQFEEHGVFLVTGSRTGRVYEVEFGRAGNVYQVMDGRRVRCFCMHVIDNLPTADNVLAQKLMLECDEMRFLRMANQTPGSGRSRVQSQQNVVAA